MRKPNAVEIILFVIALAAVTIPVSRADTNADTCESLSELAHAVMEARQVGAAQSVMERHARDAGIAGWAVPLVRLAYEQPKYTTPQAQTRAAGEFRDSVYRNCVEQLGGGE